LKVYKSNYRQHWISPYRIAERLCFWREVDYDEPWVRRLNTVTEPFMKGVQNFLDVVHPRINYVKIDKPDTWNMPETLADIILPMLKQLQKEKHGAPFTDDEDVPEELKSTSAPPKKNDWDTDDFHFERWDWIMDEMIWAFEQVVDPDAEEQFYDKSAYKDANVQEWFADFKKHERKLKFDKEGYEAWQERKSKGLLLFGKYYQNLWD
jgi:hypothetical protein